MSQAYPTQYASLTQYLQRFDSRTSGGLSSDNGRGVANDGNITAALLDASAEITAAISVGGAYSPSVINTLVASGDTMLVRICCNLAFGLLNIRRGTLPEGAEVIYKSGQDSLVQLRKGQKILNVPSTQAAPVLSIARNSSQANANLLPMTSCPFLGGPSDDRSTTDPGAWGSGSYPSTPQQNGGGNP